MFKVNKVTVNGTSQNTSEYSTIVCSHQNVTIEYAPVTPGESVADVIIMYYIDGVHKKTEQDKAEYNKSYSYTVSKTYPGDPGSVYEKQEVVMGGTSIANTTNLQNVSIPKVTGQIRIKLYYKTQSSKTYNITMCWKDEAGVAMKHGNTDATATFCGAQGVYSNPDGSMGTSMIIRSIVKKQL